MNDSEKAGIQLKLLESLKFMNLKMQMTPYAVAVFILTGFHAGYSEEKTLMYDEKKGIIFVDKSGKETESRKQTVKKTVSPAPAAPAPAKGIVTQKHPVKKKETDIHVDRQKDPPDLYFKSGLQYYKNGDYMNALKNFTYARTASPLPEYYLWMGKTYRQMQQDDKMLVLMQEILNKFSDSDVADDALFEIALYYQKNDDYELANQKYTELAEQYPFGVSFAEGEEYLEISRRQRQLMRAEMISALKVLGFEGKTINDAYQSFQQKNNLKADGKPTRETVTAIKVMYQAKLQSDTQESLEKERFGQASIVAIVAVVILGLTFWIILSLRIKVIQRIKLLTNLQNILVDLDTKNL